MFISNARSFAHVSDCFLIAVVPSLREVIVTWRPFTQSSDCILVTEVSSLREVIVALITESLHSVKWL
jgi:hypothetical protein